MVSSLIRVCWASTSAVMALPGAFAVTVSAATLEECLTGQVCAFLAWWDLIILPFGLLISPACRPQRVYRWLHFKSISAELGRLARRHARHLCPRSPGAEFLSTPNPAGIGTLPINTYTLLLSCTRHRGCMQLPSLVVTPRTVVNSHRRPAGWVPLTRRRGITRSAPHQAARREQTAHSSGVPRSSRSASRRRPAGMLRHDAAPARPSRPAGLASIGVAAEIASRDRRLPPLTSTSRAAAPPRSSARTLQRCVPTAS